MEIYQVKSGDSLSIIARDVLGDINEWPKIAQLNNLVAPYTVFPGQQLMMPDVDVLGPIVVQAKRRPDPTRAGEPAPRQASLALGLTREQLTYVALAAGALFLFLMMDRK